MVAAIVRPATFSPRQRAHGRYQRQPQHTLQAQRIRQFRVHARSPRPQHRAIAVGKQFPQPRNRNTEFFFRSEDADMSDHRLSHLVAQFINVRSGAAAFQPCRRIRFRTLDGIQRDAGIDVETGCGGKSCGASTYDSPRDNRLGKAVAAEPIKTVHVPARRFTGREQPGHVVGLTILVHANATHRIMLGRAHGNQVIRRIDAGEVDNMIK